MNSFDADHVAEQVAFEPALAQFCNPDCLIKKVRANATHFGPKVPRKHRHSDIQHQSKTMKQTNIVQLYSVNCSILGEPTSRKGTTRHARPGPPDIAAWNHVCRDPRLPHAQGKTARTEKRRVTEAFALQYKHHSHHSSHRRDHRPQLPP